MGKLHAINIILNIGDPILVSCSDQIVVWNWMKFQRIIVVRVSDEDGKDKAMRITDYSIHFSCNILKR